MPVHHLHQFGRCAASAAVVVLVFAATGYRGLANGAMMLVPPTAIAIICNRDGGTRTFMALMLIVFHVSVIAVIGASVTGD